MSNVLGKLITLAYRARQGLARASCFGPVPPHETAARLAKDGVVVMEGLLPSDRLEKIARINQGRFDYAAAAEIVHSPDGVKIQEASTLSPEAFASYYFLHIRNYGEKLDIYEHVDPLIAPILKAFYRSRYYYREMDCYRSQPVASAFQGSYAWHRDNYPPGSLKVMVYMTDVTSPEDGPLVYALGTHAGFKPELGNYGPRIPREEVEGRFELRACTGRRGTVILFDNNGVHRASNPTRGYREVLNSLILPRVCGGRPKVAGTDTRAVPGLLQKYTR